MAVVAEAVLASAALSQSGTNAMATETAATISAMLDASSICAFEAGAVVALGAGRACILAA